jgi:hypothetical protein
VLDVAVGPLRRRRLVGDGGVLGRQAEGIPAHGVQHVLAEHALVAGDDVGDRVVAHVAHVQLAAGVGEHGQAVELLAAEIIAGGEAAVLFPVLLRLALQGLGVVSPHGSS